MHNSSKRKLLGFENGLSEMKNLFNKCLQINVVQLSYFRYQELVQPFSLTLRWRNKMVLYIASPAKVLGSSPEVRITIMFINQNSRPIKNRGSLTYNVPYSFWDIKIKTKLGSVYGLAPLLPTLGLRPHH